MELEKRKFDDKDETDYYDSLEFCADLVWNGEFLHLGNIHHQNPHILILSSPEYQVKQVESHPREDTALVNVDVLDTVLLSLHPESKVKASSEVSERTREALKEFHCFSALMQLDKVANAEMKHLLETLPYTYAFQLGEWVVVKVPTDPSYTTFSQP